MRKQRLLLLGAALLFVTAEQACAQFRGGYASRGVAVGPMGGVGVSRSAGGYAAGPFGAAAGGARSGSFVTPGGSTVQYGAARGVASGPFGGAAGGVRGVQVTNPYGQTYTRVQSGGVAAGPYGGVAAGGRSATAVAGPFGAAGYRSSSGYVLP
jgi:hypothetical protein